ncbi:helix-turn-helix domain-containing protein [Priestia endophytica]|uniref:HTH domain-containing protein n=1 Tax=Priestia endophytica TaxID=135735 RepID=UPI00124EB560|nr:HTH domain-containing protein [Priestia endophytica]KAB2488202.1 HTH domain-containing protein [Priestia endophytica]
MLIFSDDFTLMQNYESYTKDKDQQKRMKYKLLSTVEAVFGDAFARLKQETRDAIDMICFLATDKGFVYAKDTYFAEKHDVSSRTIRRVMKTLEESGKIVKAHRSSSKHNGRGAAVYFFVNHPCFAHWKTYFGFDVQADVQAENTEIPCESKDEEAKKVSTYSLPKNNYIKDHFMYKTISFIKGVPKLINQTFKDLFKESLKDLYLRVRMASQKVCQSLSITLSKQDIHSIAYESIHVLFTYLKTRSMSFEDQCKLVYRIALNKFNDLVQTEDKKDEKESVVVSPRKIVRKEMLPDWFKTQQEEETPQNEEEVSTESEDEEMARMKAILSQYSE